LVPNLRSSIGVQRDLPYTSEIGEDFRDVTLPDIA